MSSPAQRSRTSLKSTMPTINLPVKLTKPLVASILHVTVSSTDSSLAVKTKDHTCTYLDPSRNCKLI